tara:strand:+ start:1785 stop:2219 length:435 start_codon:yes stop_codon:yes gene_type:complete
LPNKKAWVKRRKRKRMERKGEAAEDNWLVYFHSIKNVCPWSYESYKKGRIYITEFTQTKVIETEENWTMDKYDAIVYTTQMSVDELDTFVEQRNDEQDLCEYLWSHPSYTKGGKNQTQTPVIIQQDRKWLMELRNARSKSKRRI